MNNVCTVNELIENEIKEHKQTTKEIIIHLYDGNMTDHIE